MADRTRKLGINDIISFADDLIGILKSRRDVEDLAHVFDSIAELQSSCSRDNFESSINMEDVKQKIDTCRQKIDGQKETIAEDELKHLQNKLESELQQEQELHQKLRKIMEQIDDFESKKVYIEERKKDLMSVNKEDSRAQSEISLYASVTHVIPDMADKTGISGCQLSCDRWSCKDN
ncbi:kinetochore protein SPC24 homolog isoform X3 [Nymphaea colorata]|uniref:kinetochore protein SPC24 homolog isoform X3 n=1 Tax=Nymphaea colorata TaxID=210225 RepID=UPI00214DF999|nr:kinetochore protein SPC24 homolog isoform X3 [Nymphaea colorata]